MLDSHAHIGDLEYKDALVCTSKPMIYSASFRYKSTGLIPEGKSDRLDLLEEAASRGYLIGEIGIDRRFDDVDEQIKLFESALHIARKYNRFVSIHLVGLYEKAFNSIKKSCVDNFMIHGYTGSEEMARRFISIGGLISISKKCMKAKSFSRILSLPFVTETDMPTGIEEVKCLMDFNRYLSSILDRDIENESEKRLLERL